MNTRAGVVLAGGYARRFGDTDKTLAELDGEPLIGHVVEGLRPVVDTVVISCRAEQRAAFERHLDGVQFRADPTPDRGPLAGLAAALDIVEAEGVALAAADMPCVPRGLYDDFFGRLEGVDAVLTRDQEFLQPVPSVYRTAPLRTAAEHEHDDDGHRLRAVFETLTVRKIDAERVRDRWGDRVLTDVNTRDVLAELQASLSDG